MASVVPFCMGVCEGFREPRPVLELTFAINTLAVMFRTATSYRWFLRNVRVTLHGQPAHFKPNFMPLFGFSTFTVWTTWYFGVLSGRGTRYLYKYVH